MRGLKRKNQPRGFTLLETLVATFVIIIAIAGIFALFARFIATASFSSSKLIAAYLAQEGMEVVRNIRETNYLKMRTNPAVSWDDGLPEGVSALDYTTPGLPDPNCSFDLPLRFDGSFYNCPSGQETRFKRKVTISGKEDLNGDGLPDKMTVEVTVEWQERGEARRVTVKEQLFHWLQ